MNNTTWIAPLLLCALVAASPASAATVAATYQFQNTLAADVVPPPPVSPPALTATDPTSASGYVSDTVFGNPRTVWQFDGSASPVAQQAGLSVNTTGLIAPQSYSVEMVFLFQEKDSAWRRIFDSENRQSDSGVYIGPTNQPTVIPFVGSAQAWTNNAYHHFVVTNDGANVKAYLDGVLELSGSSNTLNLDNVNNPSRIINFFLDNTGGGSNEEYSDGRVALIRLWDGVLTDSQVQTQASSPFVVPEPSSIALMLTGLIACGLLVRRQTRRVAG